MTAPASEAPSAPHMPPTLVWEGGGDRIVVRDDGEGGVEAVLERSKGTDAMGAPKWESTDYDERALLRPLVEALLLAHRSHVPNWARGLLPKDGTAPDVAVLTGCQHHGSAVRHWSQPEVAPSMYCTDCGAMKGPDRGWVQPALVAAVAR